MLLYTCLYKVDLPQLCVNEVRAFLTRGPEHTLYISERDTVLNYRKYQKNTDRK